MQRILIRHLSGGRSEQIDSFPADSPEELIAGRDPLARIHFDPQEADLVSRQHAKIVKDADNPTAFRLIDLQSRNGTFVNQRRVYGSTSLSHSDRIQLGPSGPEFSFELDPPPFSNREDEPTVATKMTLIPPTREILPFSPTREASLGRPIGRATVERMLDDTFGLLKEESNKAFTVGLVCLVAVILVGFGTWMYIRRSSEETRLAQQQSQAAVASVLRQSEKQMAATRQLNGQVAGLSDEIRRSDQRTQGEINSLTRSVSDLKRSQDSAIALQRRQQANVPAAPASAAPAETLTFDQQLDRVSGLVKETKYADALDSSRNLIRNDPSRYEGYFYAGVCALETSQPRAAADYLRQAQTRAPAEQRGSIQRLLDVAQNAGAKGK